MAISISVASQNSQRGYWTTFGVRRRGKPEVLGFVQLSELDDRGNAEIGYVIAPQVWGEGFATEASKAVLEFGFRNLGFRNVRAVASARNMASRAVLQKLGFKEVGSETEDGIRDLIYSLERGSFLRGDALIEETR
jgi:RimJ/RimL family protein N-acetyltransferase